MDLTIDLEGTVALVTAAAGSIGSEIVRTLSRCGAHVVINDLNQEALVSLAEEIGGYPLPGDSRDFATVHELTATATANVGSPFILVNVAGMGCTKSIVEMTEDEWDSVLDLNLKTTFNWCHAVLPFMQAGGRGRIVNISSVAAKKGAHNHNRGVDSRAAYAAAKAGVLGFTRGLAIEAAPAVTVNAICPGLIPNPRNQIAVGEQERSITSDYILGRVGTGADIAKAVLYFVAADWVTGEVTDVNGGFFID